MRAMNSIGIGMNSKRAPIGVKGRAAVFGNIDAIQYGLHASLDEVAGEVRRQIHTGAQAKGFVVSTGSPFPLDSNPRVIDTMVKTAHSV